MNTEKRASIVQEELMSLYGVPPIPLVHRDAYTLLVAVLLSAQCTDKRVNLVTPALFALASTPEEMARQDVEAVREIVRPCGLSERKASSIVNLSRILVEKYEGKVPCDFAALESLPGVGHKTASVVMVQAFGVPAFPVDTHIFRLSRLWPSLITLLTGFKEDGILRCLQDGVAFRIHDNHVHFKCCHSILFAETWETNLNN